MSTLSNNVFPIQDSDILPKLIMHSSFFTANELHTASLTCKSFSKNAKEPFEELAVNQLVEYVILGNEAKAKEMLEANPKLLLKEGVATDYSGRIINGTAFQAALGAEDEHMWAMMAPYFELLQKDWQIKSAKEEMLTQFKMQFPKGFESSEADTQEIFDYYQALVEKIANAADGTAKKEIINGFRAKLNTNGQMVIHGKHFNMQHLVAAYKVYIDNFEDLALDDDTLIWQKVVGYIQRQMPANFAQAHCTGIKAIYDNPTKFKRTLSFKFGTECFPLAIDSGLGFDFACDSYPHPAYFPNVRDQEGAVGFWGYDEFLLHNNTCGLFGERSCGLPFGNFCEAKTENLRQFRRELESIEPKQAHGCCVIC